MNRPGGGAAQLSRALAAHDENDRIQRDKGRDADRLILSFQEWFATL